MAGVLLVSFGGVQGALGWVCFRISGGRGGGGESRPRNLWVSPV